jgi:uncharacterized damage-inducible protein DinB
MAIRDALLPEFDQEMATTRKVLERVPGDKLGWKPHTKSWPMGDLATHLTNLPEWVGIALNQDSLDLAPAGAELPRIKPAESQKEILERFDGAVATARATLAKATDEQLMKPWTLLRTGKTLLTLPRVAVLRSFVLNHLIHHRGQLSVYLRLNDVPVPSIYGPSADENPF